MKANEAAEITNRLVKEVETVIVGKEDVLRKLMLGILTNSHLLLEDYPGLAKTLMAKTFAAVMGCRFARVQFTPDLLPSDITGTYVFNQKSGEFELRKGPIFTNILLADEINRSPPKTQAALLEAMQERQATLDGRTHRIESPFIVIATQNPIEFEGVYQLPEAQLDRFIMRLRVGYPSSGEEKEILKRRIDRRTDDYEVRTIVDPKTLLEMQASVEDVHVHEDILGYVVEIARATREHPQIEVGVSPRGAMALSKLARAQAILEGRDYVIPDDVKSLAVPAFNHRVVMKAESWVKGIDSHSILENLLERIPVPKVP
jgi:MoxR-like ATPase